MSLRDSTELIDGIDTWMEYTIYRNDRVLPIVIKEYFEEVRTDHPSWQKMPRRMLRHRVIQQCARMALVISANEKFYKSENNKIDLIKTKETQSRKSELKEKILATNK